ncbi:TPA: hypothetical protein NV714_005033 [Escherichia coli]|nr:hypothetical protein [Escherichia coli]
MEEINKINKVEEINKSKVSSTQQKNNCSFQELLNKAINKNETIKHQENSKPLEDSALFYGLPTLVNPINKYKNIPNVEKVKKKIENTYNIDSIKKTQPKNKI